jgi:ABC-2 type transport system ATP-binding protein
VIALDTPEALKRESLDGAILDIPCDSADKATELLRGTSWARQVALFGSSVHVLVDDAEASMVAARTELESGGLVVGQIRRVDPTLEDAFISLIERADATGTPNDEAA